MYANKLCRFIFLLIVGLFSAIAGPFSHAEERVGVLMLHGKSPGSPQDPNFSVLKSRFESEGMLVELPDMPWSRNRYIDGNWDKAMMEMANHVKTLRDKGATKIVLVGHSMGAPAALSFAARKGDVQGIVMLAPGHVPSLYYKSARLQAVRESIDEARALVSANKADSTERFTDINQGRPLLVIMTPRNYLSYFDPESDAEMTVTAPRVPSTIPSIVVVGDQDPLFKLAKAHLFDRLPANAGNQYLEVKADHLSTPRESIDNVIQWIKSNVPNK